MTLFIQKEGENMMQMELEPGTEPATTSAYGKKVLGLKREKCLAICPQ